MTREELIEGLKLLEDNMVYFDELLNDKGKRIDVHELLFESIEALEQEPCEDCIFIPKGAIKVAGEDYITYKRDYLKKWWQPELALLGIDLPSIQPTTKENLVVEDCISREAVIDGIDNYIEKAQSTGAKDDFISFEELVVKALPSVTPKPKTEWISVSERYPKIEDECKYFLVTDDKGKVSVQKFLLSLEKEPQPYFSGMINVIAWMPLPEPYKAESEDKE